MYHVVFSGDENYLKFSAVCITSIIKNTDKNIGQYEENSYVFHILTDGISKNTQVKFEILENELNQIYPLEIKIHCMSDDIFQGQPKWRGNYLTYYRIMLEKFIPSDVDKVVYLDGDTLVNCDLRELFSVDLNDKNCAAVTNNIKMNYSLDSRLSKQKYQFNHFHFYFNAGVMLLNLKKWRSENFQEKTLKFLREYITKAPDQDALNAVFEENVQKLPFKWNMMLCKRSALEDYVFCDESENHNICVTRADFEEAITNPKIIHFSLKPWESSGNLITPSFKILNYLYFDLWWEMAEQVPAFKDDLLDIKSSENYLKNIAHEKALIDDFNKNKFSIKKIFYIFKIKSRPFFKKLEEPFKKIRNKFRARKIKG